MEHVFQVSGTTCGHCEMAVKRAILNVDPKAHIDIDRAHDQVQVQSEQDAQALASAIAHEGYRVEVKAAP